MIFAVWGGSFLEPNPLDWLFGAGIGTNLGASLVWGAAVGVVGLLVARKVKAAWTRLRDKIDAHHAALMEHQKHQSSLLEEMHYRAHEGVEHPRAVERRQATGNPTPTLSA